MAAGSALAAGDSAFAAAASVLTSRMGVTAAGMLLATGVACVGSVM